MIFNYKNCSCCKKNSSNIKVELNHILPANVCEMIGEHNLYCEKCKYLHEKETILLNIEYYKEHLNNTEKQIYILKDYIKSPIYLSGTNKTNLRIMKKEIDQLLDTEQLKEEFKKNKLFLSAIKSYVKRE